MSVKVIRSAQTSCYSVGNHVPWCVWIAVTRVDGCDSFSVDATVYGEDVPDYEHPIISNDIANLAGIVTAVRWALALEGLPVTCDDVRVLVASVKDLEVLTR